MNEPHHLYLLIALTVIALAGSAFSPLLWLRYIYLALFIFYLSFSTGEAYYLLFHKEDTGDYE